MKRLVVGVFVSSLALFGVVPAASAASATATVSAKVHKAKKPAVIDWDAPKPGKAIDWDAPKPISGGMSTQRIDWD
jgi:hypothetical protein